MVSLYRYSYLDESWCTLRSTSSVEKHRLLLCAAKKISLHVEANDQWESCSIARTTGKAECRPGMRKTLSCRWSSFKPNENLPRIERNRCDESINEFFILFYGFWKYEAYFTLSVGFVGQRPCFGWCSACMYSWYVSREPGTVQE